MTRDEHLLTIVMEECAEVGQRAAKALRFGLEQVQQDTNDRPEENPDRLTNKERMHGEFVHLVAVLEMIEPELTTWTREAIDVKRARVEQYLKRSSRCGTLSSLSPATPQGWQPIETAPKDGAWILVVISSGVKMSAFDPEAQRWKQSGGGFFGVCPPYHEQKGFDSRPTHWMPLPAAPATPQEK